MKTLHVKKLEKYQPGYKDRNLIWCKMYFSMINGDPEFEMLCEIDKMRLISFIMLEMQIKKPVPLDEVYLSRKGFDFKKRPISSTLQMLHTFIEVRNETVTEDSEVCDETVTQIRLDKEKIKDKRSVTEKCNNSVIILPQWLSKELWNDYLDMRKSIKGKATIKAQQLIIEDLIKFKDAGHDPVDILKQSIKNSWKGVFEIKDKPKPPECKPTNYLESDYYKKATKLQREGKTIDLKTAATRIMAEIKDKKKAKQTSE